LLLKFFGLLVEPREYDGTDEVAAMAEVAEESLVGEVEEEGREGCCLLLALLGYEAF